MAGTGPLTVVGQTGELKRLVDWTASAWFDIQAMHQDWRFLRTTASWATVQAQATYTTAQCGIPAGTFSAWVRDSFRNYPTATGQSGEIFMPYLPYTYWRNQYQFGAYRTTYSRPIEMTVTPDDGIGLGPVPLSGYTILGDYFSAPVLLSADADVPTLPAKHNPMLIVYHAMESYGAFEAAPEVYQRGLTEFTKLLRRLEADQLPEYTLGGALC